MAKAKVKDIIQEFVFAGKEGGGLKAWGGLNTIVKDFRTLNTGQTYSAVNWITGRDKDHIELRRGQALLGTTRRNIPGKSITGLGIGTLSNNNQVPIFTYGRSIAYFDGTDTHEVTIANILPAGADGEDTNIIPYTNLAGSFLYVTSPHSSWYKIAAANPQSVKDQGAPIANFLFGWAKIDQNRVKGLQRYGQPPTLKDPTGYYLGRVDQQGNSNAPYPLYMSVTAAPTGTPHLTGGSMSTGTYYYVITAVIGTGASGIETTKGAQSLGIVLGSTSAGSIDLTWTKIAGATTYNIYRTTSSGTYTTPALITSGLTTNTFTDTLASPATGAPPATTTLNIVAILGTGDGSTKTFSGILPAFVVPASVVPTAFNVQITDGNEVFNDDHNGNLVGSLGGTGTINYVTAAYSVTFKTAPISSVPITSYYQSELSTSGGVLDFTINTSDTTGAYAQVFRQDDGGGNGMAAGTFQGVDYVYHLLRTWNFQASSGSSTIAFSNLPYWSQIGIPYPRAMFESGDGVIYLDNTNQSSPKVSILEIPPGSTNLTVVPVPLSLDLDLSGFAYDKCVVFRWGDYDIMECMSYTNGQKNTYNSVTFIRNIYSGIWNQLDYTFNCLGAYLGTLISGDSLSPNIFTLFSGFDDDGAAIDNYWNTAYTDLGIPGMKKSRYVHASGLIQPTQKLVVSVSLDFGNYTPLFTILGNGSYVNNSGPVGVGFYTIGSQTVGAGSAVFANPYEIDIQLLSDLYEYISIQIQAIDVGYVSLDNLSLKDNRLKRQRISQYNDISISPGI